MFEGRLAALLDTLLGSYVKSYDKDSLRVAVWAGEVRKTSLQSNLILEAALGGAL